MLKQNTLNGSFSLCGKGLHTGLSLTVTFNPAATMRLEVIRRFKPERKDSYPNSVLKGFA